MELNQATWRTSSRSGASGNNCVEVADNLPGVVGVRDSKDRSGPVLVLPHDGWVSFVAGVKGGAFDL